ncbi:MAG: tetratricopeptide repeat protein [Odoribacter sp.]
MMNDERLKSTKTMRLFILFFFVVLAILPATAQKERKFIREGNNLFEKQDFEKAEVEYRKAADKKTDSFVAAFNMADALYKQKKYDEALQQFSVLAKEETDKQRLGEIYHNIGNTLLSMNKMDESIQAYKESLRNRPDSEQTKYNLEFVRNKQQQDQQNKDNKDNQDQNKDQQNQDNQNDQNKKDQDQKNQDKKDQNNNQQDQNKDQQNKDQQNKDNQDKKDNQDNKEQQQSQPQEGKISKEDATRLLEALQNDEKNVQEKVQKQKVQEQKAKKMKIEKNW